MSNEKREVDWEGIAFVVVFAGFGVATAALAIAIAIRVVVETMGKSGCTP